MRCVPNLAAPSCSRFPRYRSTCRFRCRSRRCCGSTLHPCPPRHSWHSLDQVRPRRSIAPVARRRPAITSAAVLRFPDAAAGRADINGQFARGPGERRRKRRGRSWSRNRCCARGGRRRWQSYRALVRRRRRRRRGRSQVKRIENRLTLKRLFGAGAGNLNSRRQPGHWPRPFRRWFFVCRPHPFFRPR